MMTNEAQAKYDAKWKRIRDAIALKEPDRIPITPSPAIFPILTAGYTVAEVIYDTTLEKAKDAMRKYLIDFDPDNATVLGNYAGEGPLMELQQPTTMRWAGMPGNPIPENSLQQYIEFPMLSLMNTGTTAPPGRSARVCPGAAACSSPWRTFRCPATFGLWPP